MHHACGRLSGPRARPGPRGRRLDHGQLPAPVGARRALRQDVLLQPPIPRPRIARAAPPRPLRTPITPGQQVHKQAVQGVEEEREWGLNLLHAADVVGDDLLTLQPPRLR